LNAPLPSSVDAAPAYALWVQFATRITTQKLHFRSGDDESVAKSVFALFSKVRELMEAHPEAGEFRKLGIRLLNELLRPYAARWHGWMTGDASGKDPSETASIRFRDPQVRRAFRQELLQLREELLKVQAELALMAGIHNVAAETSGLTATLGVDLRAGIRDQVNIKSDFDGAARAQEINAKEHATILERRAILSPDAKAEGPLLNATGLALSGGGIRSATFCLGIVQVLARRGLLLHFDYLSTVSGGGYLGSFLSCALGTRQPDDTTPRTRAAAEAKVNDVFQRSAGIESGLVRHLRNHSKYLLHGGLIGKIRMLGLLASGLAWNLMIVLPIPLFAAILAFVAGPWLWEDAMLPNGPAVPAFPESPSGMALKWLAILFGLAWVALPGLQLLAHGQAPKSKRALFHRLWENGTVALGILTVTAAAVFLMPALFHGHEWLRTSLAKWSHSGSGLESLAGLLPTSLTGVAGAALAALIAWLSPRWPRLRTLAVRLFILTGPLFLIFTFLYVGNRMGLSRDGVSWMPHVVFWVTLGLALWNWFCVNINTLAPHRYYRNRLCECYLARRIPEEESGKHPLVRALSGERAQGRTEVLKQVKLSELGADPAAPYHLVNMVVNAPSSRNKNLRGRDGDFFMVSRHFYGSPLTGYAATENLEQGDPHFDLGTALAVSGAAASTSMGWKSLPHFRFLMTLFNVRLGYWIRNPGRKVLWRMLEGAGPWYLFREMFGLIHEQCRYVNLSDGGHIENLAAYELLRRRCKFIVCVDGGCEPEMECSDLTRLQRYAEIDLGIRMYPDISDLRLDSKRFSRSHAVLVKIDYAPETAPGKELGWMLYVKLATTGLEPAHLADYRRLNPDFPHQSTADQIYDEAQFEAYRALGECAMEAMFREEIAGNCRATSIREWFHCLANNLLPDNDPVFARSKRQ